MDSWSQRKQNFIFYRDYTQHSLENIRWSQSSPTSIRDAISNPIVVFHVLHPFMSSVMIIAPITLEPSLVVPIPYSYIAPRQWPWNMDAVWTLTAYDASGALLGSYDDGVNPGLPITDGSETAAFAGIVFSNISYATLINSSGKYDWGSIDNFTISPVQFLSPQRWSSSGSAWLAWPDSGENNPTGKPATHNQKAGRFGPAFLFGLPGPSRRPRIVWPLFHQIESDDEIRRWPIVLILQRVYGENDTGGANGCPATT